MVNLYFLFRAAEFTGVRKNSLEEFAPVGHDELRKVINQDGFLLPLRGIPPKRATSGFLFSPR